MTSEFSERALILAPHGRDAQIAASILAEAGLATEICRSLPMLHRGLDQGAGFALMTEEGLKTADLRPLADWLGAQPEWSDFPFILLTQSGGGIERNPSARRFLAVLGNVTFLERPFHPTTLISLAEAALRGRRRQYEARARLGELHSAAQTLEERVLQRTQELERTQDALRQAQKLESIGQLTGGIAHDFNNLLMAIMSSLTLLAKRVPQEAQLLRLIDNALQGTQRGAALTQRMLAFARRQDLSSTRVDVAGLVRGMKELVERTIGPEWTLDLRIPAEMPPIMADANQLEMALLNLAVNARDAMADGGVIVITAEHCNIADGEIDALNGGSYVALSVVDTGTGMDAETLERATEPFFTTKGIGKGTGLGLPMIHGLAKQLSGTFVLESELGEGTKATLWLPSAEAEQPQLPAKPAIAEDASPAGPLKILVVDDDALILMNTSALLEDLGHHVVEASSGAAAIALIEDEPDFDLLITDQAMPIMTGSQLIQQVAAIRPSLPIILATGYGEVPTGFETSVVKLGKPFAQQLLVQAIGQAIGRVMA